jgi:hypothetical protein
LNRKDLVNFPKSETDNGFTFTADDKIRFKAVEDGCVDALDLMCDLLNTLSSSDILSTHTPIVDYHTYPSPAPGGTADDTDNGEGQYSVSVESTLFQSRQDQMATYLLECGLNTVSNQSTAASVNTEMATSTLSLKETSYRGYLLAMKEKEEKLSVPRHTASSSSSSKEASSSSREPSPKEASSSSREPSPKEASSSSREPSPKEASSSSSIASRKAYIESSPEEGKKYLYFYILRYVCI